MCCRCAAGRTPDRPRLDLARRVLGGRASHRRASQRRCRVPRLSGLNAGTLASRSELPGRSRPRVRRVIRCRQRTPRTRTDSTPSVSLRPTSARAGLTASQARASGERAARQRLAAGRGACARRARPRSVRAGPGHEIRAGGNAEVGGTPTVEETAPTVEPAAPTRGVRALRRRSVGGRASQHITRMLHVVVRRPIDVGEVSQRHRDQRQPVVVKIPARPGREGQCVVEHPSAKQAGGTNHRVRDQKRGDVRVVVAPPIPQRLPAHVPGDVDPPQVAVDELG